MSLIQGEKNQIIIKPFIYGSVAINLGRKSKEEATHKWCVYVRGIHNENISNFIKSVKFTLHDTFQNNIRTITKWPFELYETGWGEFDIKIQIQLIDETVKPIDLVHSLKFYHVPHSSGSSKRPVVSENYDEIIFVNPKPEILEQLLKDDNKIFQEPLNKKISSENIDENDANKDSIVMGSSNNLNNLGNSMDVEEEDKSAIVSRMDSNLNLNNNNSVISMDKGGVLIPNVEQYFGKIDDSSQFKELQEKNQFILQEIEKLKKELNIKEEEIMKLNKEIRKNKI
jgi:transcription initiation factor IIF auxiliary subunit